VGGVHRLPAPIVAANTHGLTVRLAGAFTPTAEQLAAAEQVQALGIEVFDGARATVSSGPTSPTSTSNFCSSSSPGSS
jgi:hypothetical protein